MAGEEATERRKGARLEVKVKVGREEWVCCNEDLIETWGTFYSLENYSYKVCM